MALFALVFVVATAAAAPQFDTQPEVFIVSQTFEQDKDGSYEYAYKLSNDQEVQEAGRVQPGPEPETGSIEKKGFYTYVDNEGNSHSVTYTAGSQGGYQAQSDDLPQPPAQIPEYEQLRRDHPKLFWAENGGADVVLNNQEFNNEQFIQSQNQEEFDQSQFVQQQLDNQQQFLLPLRQLSLV